jgi:predicted nucleotidyltransferase
MSLSKVRLSTEEIEAIKRIIKQYDKDAQVFLFGSRTDPEKKAVILT